MLTVLGGLACLLAGEGGVEGGAEAGGGDVGVDLGGGDGGVAEELADVHEGGAVFEEVGGVGVAEGVGSGLGAFGQEGVDAAVDDGGNQGAAGAAAGGAEKKRGARGEEIGGQIAFLIGEREVFAGLEPTEERGVGGRAIGDDAFFIALAVDAEGAGAEVGIVQVQADEFGTAQSTAIEQLQRHAVAEGVEVIAVDGLNQFVEFDFGERFGEAFGAFGGGKGVEGRGLDAALVEEPVEEGADGGGVLGEGGGGVAAALLQAAEVVGEDCCVHTRPVANASAEEVIAKGAECIAVGSAGGRREAAGVLRGI